MNRLFFLAVILALGLAPVTGASADTADKVAVTGDTFTVEEKTHQATFSGNVVVTEARLKLTADQVVATYGDGGASNIKSFVATGHVKIVTKDQTATGEKATFDPKTKILTLTGNVLVVSAAGQMKGPELTLDLKQSTSVFSGGKSGRVTGVFTSQ